MNPPLRTVGRWIDSMYAALMESYLRGWRGDAETASILAACAMAFAWATNVMLVLGLVLAADEARRPAPNAGILIAISVASVIFAAAYFAFIRDDRHVKLLQRYSQRPSSEQKHIKLVAWTYVVASYASIVAFGFIMTSYGAVVIPEARNARLRAVEDTGEWPAYHEWAPSYRRATLMQAPLAIAGGLSAISAWFAGAGAGWLAGGIRLLSVVPFTFLAVMPTSRALLAPEAKHDLPRTALLLARWNRLHGLRSGLSTLAVLLFVSLLRNWRQNWRTAESGAAARSHP